MSAPRLLNLPNLITLARIATIPVIVWLLSSGDVVWRLWALMLFIGAAGTDWVDGFLARWLNQVTPFGRMLDPIADKLLVGLVLLALAWDGSLSEWDLAAVTAILFREFFVSGLREFLGNENVTLPVTFLAKWKTALQLIAIGIILAERIAPGLRLISDVALWVAAGVTVVTGVQYLIAAWPVLAGTRR